MAYDVNLEINNSYDFLGNEIQCEVSIFKLYFNLITYQKYHTFYVRTIYLYDHTVTWFYHCSHSYDNIYHKRHSTLTISNCQKKKIICLHKIPSSILYTTEPYHVVNRDQEKMSFIL